MSRATEPRVRPMEAGDVEAVAELERVAFTTPWRADTFRTLLERPGAEMLVLEDGGVVIGYVVLWCIVDQGEIANIAVTPERRGEGLGVRLLRETLEVARDRGVRSLFLEVRVSNEVARAMYLSNGFREIGIRRDYYDDPREDALVLQTDLSGPAALDVRPPSAETE